MFVYRIVNLYI